MLLELKCKTLFFPELLGENLRVMQENANSTINAKKGWLFMAEHQESQSLLHFLKAVLSPFKLNFLFWFVISMGWGLDTSVRPYILKMILDRIGLGIEKINFAILIFPVLLYLFFAILQAFISRIHNLIIMKTGPEIKKQAASLLFEKMMNKSIDAHQDGFSGALSSSINDVITSIPILIGICIEGAFYYLIILISSIWTLSTVNANFATALFLWVMFILLFAIVNVKKSNSLATESARSWANISGKIVDLLLNIINVHFFASKKHENLLFTKALDNASAAEKNRNYFLLKMYIVHGISLIVLQAYSLFYLIKGVLAGNISVGDFSMVLSINHSISDTLWAISQDFTTFADNLGKLLQGFNILSYKQQLRLGTESTNQKLLNVNQGEINFENISFRYGGKQLLFKNKQIIIKAGQKVGLVGHSGSGKSTFINLILRLFDVQQGRILIDGQDISKVSIESLSNSISVIPQDPPLFHRSLLENIRYGNLNATDEEVIEAAKKAHAHDFIIKLPEGYNTLIGERGSTLSGGQRQRIAIARAILKNAKILIFDEATNGLDPITESLVQESLLEIGKEKTVIVVAHKLSTLSSMDRILVFDQGKIIDDGSPQELLSKDGPYKSLWLAQQNIFV